MMAIVRRRLGPISVALALALIGVSAHAQEAAAPFSDAERARLRAGELVRRSVSRTERRYSMTGGTSFQLVRAPLSTVWATVLDTSLLPRLIPSLERVRVVEDREHERLLEMHHAYSFASADYFARLQIDRDAHEVRFAVDPSRPSDLRAGRGFLRLSRYRGDTIVSWGVLADLGAVAQVLGPMLHDWMLRVPRCVRDEVEPGRRNGC